MIDLRKKRLQIVVCIEKKSSDTLKHDRSLLP